jgi:hypothetical protein
MTWNKVFLKQQQLRKLRYGDVPDLLSLTNIAHAVVLEELERTRCDYGVFIGNQIHTLEGRNFVWPGATYAVKDKKPVEPGWRRMKTTFLI